MSRFDFRHSLRSLLRTPAFTLITLLTLALGIGANTAIFSLVYGVLIKPLPYPESDRLVAVANSAPGIGLDDFQQSDATFFHFRTHNHVFDEIGLYTETTANLTGAGTPERLDAALFTDTMLAVLDTPPALGRGFLPEEGRPGGETVVLLSHGLWQRRFGADPRILERSIELDGVQHRVVGVMGPGFAFPRPEAQLWLPLTITPAEVSVGNFNYDAVARLKGGITPELAKADLDPLVWSLPEAFPGEITVALLEKARFNTIIRPLRDEVVGDVGSALWILLGTVGFLLLIACANVANLFLVRGEGRQREVAVRTALGAGRGHLAGFFLTESFLLAVGGAALGLSLAAAAIEALKVLDPGNLPRLHEVGLDGAVLAFTGLLAVLTALAFGLVPVFRAGGEKLVGALKGGSRATVGRERQRARGALVAVQMALALVLLVGSGLMVRSFHALSRVDPGFKAEKALTLRLSVPRAEAPEPAAGARFYTELLDRLGALPGVRRVGAASELPLTDGQSRQATAIEDFPIEPDELPKIFPYKRVSHGYFEAMGIPLVAGRTFEVRDWEEATGTAVVSQAFAESLWPGQSALGKRLQPGGGADEEGWYTIVGVVGKVHDEALTADPEAMVYYPMVGIGDDDWVVRTMSVVIATQVDPLSLADGARETVWALNPNLPVANVRTLEAIVARSTARTTFTLTLLALGAAMALVLGAVGLYGVISYIVGQRRQEIGVRMALGAERGEVARMVVAQGLTLTAVGLGLGLAGAFALTRLMGSLLFGVSATDPLTFGSVPLLLLAVALLATWLPARRAASVEPVEAIKGE